MITDIPRLYEKTMYLNELEIEAERIGVEIDAFVIRTSHFFPFEAKLQVNRLLKGLSLLNEMRRYDVLHVQFTLPFGLLFALTEGFHRKPVLIHTHGYDVFTIPSMDVGLRRIKVADFLSKLSWKATSHIVAVCEKAKQVITDEGVSPEKISVLYNGVDESFFRRRKIIEDEKLNTIREKSDFVLLNVGNLVPVKNHKMLLNAFTRVLKKDETNLNITLVVCGEGPMKGELHAIARRLGIEKNVLFLGRVPHFKMPELYNIADAFILPSLSEAHPWSLLEAMSCELPVTASNVGGIPETLDDKSLLFEPLKPTDICRAIIYLAEDSRRRKFLGMRNRNIVLKNFTLQKHVTNLCSIYSKIYEISG